MKHATMSFCTYIAYVVTLILYKHNIMPRWQKVFGLAVRPTEREVQDARRG